MKKLIEEFDKKSPEYSNKYRDLIDKLSRNKAVDKSIGTDEEQTQRGKAFGSFYECYMYAFIVGIRANYTYPLEKKDSKTFINIGAWKPQDMKEYIFMSLLALSNIEFITLENLEDEQASKTANELVNLMEQYACGGFELISEKNKQLPDYFENTLNVVAYLQEIKPVN